MYGICVKIFIRNRYNVYFKELHNDQEYYWPTTYRAWAAVVSTITIINPLGPIVTNINFFPNNNQLKDNLGGN